MKIIKDVSIQVEVEVDIFVDDIAHAIYEDTDSERKVLNGVSNTLNFFKAIPNRMVSEMPDEKKQIIFNHLTEQAKRFKPNTAVSALEKPKNVTDAGNPTETIKHLARGIMDAWVTSTWMPGEMPKQIRKQCFHCLADVEENGVCNHKDYCVVPIAKKFDCA